MSVFGAAVLPGKKSPWQPPIADGSWSEIQREWRALLGRWDGMAIYERTQEGRAGLSLLLLQGGSPLAFIKARQDHGESLEVEADALRRMSDYRPRTFVCPEVVALRQTAGWHHLVLTSLPPRRHHSPKRAPLDMIQDEIAEGLSGLPRPGGVPDHWRPMHGDLTPWNLRRFADGRLVLYDWEDAGWGPPDADRTLYQAASFAVGNGAARPSAGEAASYWRDRLRRRHAADPRDRRLSTLILRALDPAGCAT